MANSLIPNNSYPQSGLPGLLISGLDDFNSTPIKLTKAQLDSVQENGNIYSFVTQYKAKVNPGSEEIWEKYLTQSKSTTATIKLILPNGKSKERRIAARTVVDYTENEYKPAVSLEDAFKLMNLNYDKKTKEWNILDDRKKVVYRFKHIRIITDNDSLDSIKEQLESVNNEQRGFDKIMLMSKMRFFICPLGSVVDVKNPDNIEVFLGDCKRYVSLPKDFTRYNILIENSYSKKVLSVKQPDNNEVVQFESSTLNNIAFNIVPRRSSKSSVNNIPTFKIKPVSRNGEVLQLNTNGTIELGGYGKNALNQKWFIMSDIGSDSMKLINAADPNSLLDLAECNNKDGVKIKVSNNPSCITGSSATWKFKMRSSVPDDFYKTDIVLKSVANGSVITLLGKESMITLDTYQSDLSLQRFVIMRRNDLNGAFTYPVFNIFPSKWSRGAMRYDPLVSKFLTSDLNKTTSRDGEINTLFHIVIVGKDGADDIYQIIPAINLNYSLASDLCAEVSEVDRL
ncbi:MAG: hypothetical protein K2X04_07165 [Burkholderiales bacterium]|nr:hypothetical protein [Burkholderiales bacterium]